MPSCLRTAIDMRGPSTAAAAAPPPEEEEGPLLLFVLLRAAAAAAATEAAVGVETAEEGCVVAAEAYSPPFPPATIAGPKREGTDCWCGSIEEALLLPLLVFSPKSAGANGENPEAAPAAPPPLPPIEEVVESGVPGPLWGMLAIPPPREEEEKKSPEPEPPSKSDDDGDRGWWC